MPVFTATLMGGPKDGQVVEIVGWRYRFAEKVPELSLVGEFAQPPESVKFKIRYGIYAWDCDWGNPGDQTKYIGVWKGYEE